MVRVVAVVPGKVGDAAVRVADAAPVKVDGAKVGAARARVEEALVKAAGVRADADLVREASRRVIRRHQSSA